MQTLLRLLLKSQHQRKRFHQTQTEKGVTLIELLIGTVMAFLIITPMLGFVVDMLNTDRREQIKTNTEQDIQAAVDFIAQDLSQAIYIYDNNPATTTTGTTTPTGIPALLAGNFIPPPNANQTPILVFWKRQILKNSLPLTAGDQPNTCVDPTTPNGTGSCNDTYVLALVAYYQVRENNPNSIWCQPSGAGCPSRIVRYQIQDGLRDPNSTNPDPSQRYFAGRFPSAAFFAGGPNQAGFDISNPTQNVTTGAANFTNNNLDVLVNYIDDSPGPPVTNNEECTTALGNPTITTGVTATPVPETTLRIPAAPDTVNSFYACVDTQRNLARVTIRGNSLRRLQPNNADYDAKRSAFFPTATVQVQGLGARGR
ncbi:hormogonium polysaccharide secretion pseudopilin HpsC [Microcoleus sp. herbarium19]|uniref:hormogonium polysaccharide secretion pseudopilin HpsC n=1 Tax=Microcoleus sp. herbarium19 TaxID=3055440 RepID=UPI002FD33406